MTLLQRGKVIYSTTSVAIPVELKKQAQLLKINISGILVEALEHAVAEKTGVKA